MSEFIEAVKNNEIELTKQYLRAGININSRNVEDGTTALYWAACMGHVQLCSLLLEAGADVNITGSQWGSRPLHAAADRGHVQCAYLLIRSGAAVDAQTLSNLDTPLHKAAFRGHQRMVSLLLEHGANVRAKNKEGKTPRQEAQNGKHYTVHQILLDNEQRLSRGKTSTHSQRKSATQTFNLQRDHHTENPAAISAPLQPNWSRHDVPDGMNSTKSEPINGFVTVETNCTPTEAMNDIDKITTSKCAPTTNINQNDTKVYHNGHHDQYAGSLPKDKVGNPQYATSNGQTNLEAPHKANGPHAGHEHDIPKSSLILLEESNGDTFSSYNDEQKELIFTRSQLHTTKLRLMQLEGYTEKLQLCVVKAREKLYALNSENEHLRKILVSMGRLEEQLSAAKEQIKAQNDVVAMDKHHVFGLQQQIGEMQRRYNELNAAYHKVCSSVTYANRHGHLTAGSHNALDSSHLSMSGRPNGDLPYMYEGDVDNTDAESQALNRLTPRGLTSDSSPSTSSTSPSPPHAPPSSRAELSGATPRTSKSQTCRHQKPSSSRGAEAKDHTAARSQPIGEVNTRPLFEAIAPVIATAGREFMDMLTASLLFQTKKSITESTPRLLDDPGTAWAPDNHYNITETVDKPCHTIMEPGKQCMMKVPVTHKDHNYQLKVILDCIVAPDGSLPPADVTQIQFIQNILLRVQHKNVSTFLHGFRAPPSPALRSLLPEQCQTEEASIVALHTVHPRYPSNLSELVQRARSTKSHPEHYFPEKFIMHLLYGTLSGLHFLREQSIVHGHLSLEHVRLTSSLQPVIASTEFGFSTRSVSGEEQPLADVDQLHTSYPGVVPPEIDKLRKGWKQECSNKKLLREVYRTTDVYVLGVLFLDMLCHGWSGTETGTDATVGRNFPLRYSQNVRRLLQWMSLSDYHRRPSPRQARLRTGMLLFGPERGEVKSLSDCQIWQHTKMMKFLLHSPATITEQPESDSCQTVRDSIAVNHVRLEHEYLTSITSGDIWSEHSNPEWQ